MCGGPNYEEHLTAFIDFLGFSEASFDDPLKIEAILSTLQQISSLKSEAGLRWFEGEGEGPFTIEPAVSSFSDHIVLSYPTSQLRSLAPEDELSLSLAFPNLRYRVGMIAAQAFQLGFLIRGGISIGGLYHSRGIVFGDALIEAYRLESSTAVYPRIVVASSVADRPEFERLDSRLVRQDCDGQHCFEYIFPMLMSLNTEPVPIQGMTNWYRDNIGHIDEQIRIFSGAGRTREAAKWEWFRTELQHSLIRHGARAAML